MGSTNSKVMTFSRNSLPTFDARRGKEHADRALEHGVEVALREPEVPIGVHDARLQRQVQPGGAGGIKPADGSCVVVGTSDSSSDRRSRRVVCSRR